MSEQDDSGDGDEPNNFNRSAASRLSRVSMPGLEEYIHWIEQVRSRCSLLMTLKTYDLLDILHSYRSQLRRLCCTVCEHFVNVFLVCIVLLDALSNRANSVVQIA